MTVTGMSLFFEMMMVSEAKTLAKYVNLDWLDEEISVI